MEARILAGGLTPAAVYLNGAQIDATGGPVKLGAGSNPLLLRYDGPGRGHFALQRSGAPEPSSRTPLSMRWYDLSGLVPFDPWPGATKPVGWYRFLAPPGLRGMVVTARGELRAWADGRPLRVESRRALPRGAMEYSVALPGPSPRPVRVALRIEPARGFYGGAALPDPVLLECGPGLLGAGDWSQGGALECYSGGAWYRRTVPLPPERARGRVFLALGDVAATAEVRVNGRPAGVRVAPPWRFDVSELVRPGENRIEIRVFNTLANHYLTIPTRYRGSTRSGLIGPVRIETRG
jgi:hypothetical protein